MWTVLRRKVVSAGSSALVNGTIESLERAQPALVGSTSRGFLASTAIPEALNLGSGSAFPRQFHQGRPVYTESARSVVSSLKTGFSTQMWSRSCSSHGAPSLKKSGDSAELNETICQVGSDEGFVPPVIPSTEKMNFAGMEKASNGPILVDRKAGGAFMISSGVYGSLLSTPIVNAPQTAQMAMPAIASPTFLPNLALFWHINNGVEEILADYVHHEMTRSLVLIIMRLFLIIAAKDVFLLTN